jgi:hypothetical protein
MLRDQGKRVDCSTAAREQIDRPPYRLDDPVDVVGVLLARGLVRAIGPLAALDAARVVGDDGAVGEVAGQRHRVKRGEATNGTAALWGIITSAVAHVLSVVGLVIVVGLIGTVAEAVSTTPADPAPTQPADDTAPAAEEEPTQAEPEPDVDAGIGDTVHDGQFDFVVTEVEPPVETVGEDIMAEDAQGQFIVVRVTVTNVGDEARTLDSSSQYLYDAEGRRYETSSAIFVLPDYDKTFLENVNPGNTVEDAPLLYDVSEGFVSASIELHDSPFSGGVTVALS